FVLVAVCTAARARLYLDAFRSRDGTAARGQRLALEAVFLGASVCNRSVRGIHFVWGCGERGWRVLEPESVPAGTRRRSTDSPLRTSSSRHIDEVKRSLRHRSRRAARGAWNRFSGASCAAFCRIRLVAVLLAVGDRLLRPSDDALAEPRRAVEQL